ncbi:MAG: ABC transporter substrate-binding protein [Bacillota bacterium]|nr:ABC transporter substrate-binding protein [Bacillota bacterium]
MKKVVSFILALVMVLSLAACSKPSGSQTSSTPASSSGSASEAGSKPDSSNPIKIGYLAWASGSDAYFGLVAIAALKDRIADINAKGGLLGREVQLIWYDISQDFSESVNATNKLINQDHVTAIIGPDGSPFAITLGGIVEQAKVPLLPNCGNKEVTVNKDGTVKPYVFRVAPVNSLTYETLAQYAYKVLGARKVAQLTESTNISTVESANEFDAAFKKLGGEIVANESYMQNDTEFRAQITKVAQAKPEYVFMPAAAYKEVCNFANQLNDMGYKDIKILGSDAWYNDDALKVAGNSLDGAIVISALDMNSENIKPMVDDFAKKHAELNASLHLYALYACNALQFVEYAINKTQSTDGPTLKEALETTDGVDMLTGGKWKFNENHDPVGPQFTILSIENGKAVSKGSYSIEEK